MLFILALNAATGEGRLVFMAIEIFFSYSHQDETYLEKLKSHLSPLQRQRYIDVMWHDRGISAGIEWKQELDNHLNTAHLILLLISPDFIRSNYCTGIEMERALARHEQGEARVIPVILRPCLWQEMPFGKLQALPEDGKAVSTWPNDDEAFLNVALGIRKALKEIRIQLLARKITLFGYEMDGGTNSPLWKNPSLFADDERFSAWQEMKRPITDAEVIDQTWIKVSHFGSSWSVHFDENGKVTEHALSDPNHAWSGSWRLIDGVLRINLGPYEMDIFANRGKSSYSAIEFKKHQKDPQAFHIFFPHQEKALKHWSLEEASALVTQACKHILHRQPKPEELVLYGALLVRGEHSMRDLVRLLALSPEYRRRFVYGKTTDEALEYCYQHFLGRKADGPGKQHYSQQARTMGMEAIILEIIESPEYNRVFGEDIVAHGQ